MRTRLPRGRRGVLVLVLVVLLLAVVAVVGVRAWQAAHRSTLQQALALAPGDAERFSFTDWAAVRRAAGGADLDAGSPYRDVQAFLDEAFDRDLSSTSAMVGSAQVLQDEFGFSPASATWELFSQSTSGASVVVQLPDDLDLGELGDTLEGLGYTPPEEREGTGTWVGGADLVARISGGVGLSPEYQFVALDRDRHRLLASDTPAYLEQAVRAATGRSTTVQGLDPVAAALDDPLSAAVYSGGNACRALAMSQADEDDQQVADQLLEEAGSLDPLTGFAMAAEPDGSVRVAMSFETADQARDNADTRAALAEGPAVGQGGDFADRFALRSARAEGDVVTLDLQPVEGAFVLSDLSTGPVLFATC